MGLSEKILAIIVCPKCKLKLEYKEDESSLICYSCRLKYEIKDDIPNMLIDEAKSLEK